MLEETLPAIWASMNSWFTPTLLFVFINLVIGTIAIASNFGKNHQQDDPHYQQQQQQQPPQAHFLARSPSMLQRLKSINLNRYRSQEFNPFSTTTIQVQPQEEQHHITTTFHPEDHEDQTHEEEQDSFEKDPFEMLDNLQHHVKRTTSDTKPYAGNMPDTLSKKMKKSASSKSVFPHFEEEEVKMVEKTRPMTVRPVKKKVSDFQLFGADDQEVDAKADDFINKFKNQLKLQRMDSILRYKEMIGRSSKQVD